MAKDVGESFEGLLLPLTNLNWMQFVPGSNFRQRTFAAERIECNLGLELRWMDSTFGHWPTQRPGESM
jgi:hypothetical protein